MQIDATTNLKIIRTLNPCVRISSKSQENALTCPITILRSSMFAIGWNNGKVRIWNWETGEEARILENLKTEVMSLRALNNGNMAVLRENNIIEIWNPYNGGL